MEFAFSEEQDEFRAMVRRFFEEKSPITEVRKWMDAEPGYDVALWRQMAEELGLQGVYVPEALGGQGFGFLELGIVQEEMGRALVPSPFFGSACLATSALRCVASEAEQKDLLPGLCSGESIAALALAEGESFDPARVALEARPDGGEFALSGEKHWLPHGHAADLFLVVARRPGTQGAEGLSLLAVRRGEDGVATEPVESLDGTRPLATLRLEGARARVLGDEGAAGPGIAKALHHANVALACELSGAAQRCLELAVDYAKVRVQFARPIGSFQAVKHRCAEMLLETECAKVAATYAAWVAAEDGDDLPRAASLAKSYCADAALQTAADNLQIHGGIGFTWEADAHLYLKRARSAATLLGDPVAHRRALAEQLGF